MSADYEFMAHLYDPITNHKKDIDISVVRGQLSIAIQGYENINGEETILIDLSDNKLKVYCWADITKEDPTDIIDMEGAKVEKRTE